MHVLIAHSVERVSIS